MKTKYLYLTLLAISIIIIYLLLHKLYMGHYYADMLRYPGNGIPYLSKNIEIKKLNNDITNYSYNFSTMKMMNSKLFFNDIDNYSYVSKYKLYGNRYCVQINFSIEKGRYKVIIGNVEYIIEKNSININNNNNNIYTNPNVHITSIIIENFGQQGYTRLYNNDKILGVFNIVIKTPASISMIMTNGCSGYIGPWTWLRGYI